MLKSLNFAQFPFLKLHLTFGLWCRAAFDYANFSAYKYSKLRNSVLMLKLNCGMHYEPLLCACALFSIM